ncbi:MAG: hypothetical protein ACLR7Z_19325 [Bilophila wadsworthia]
MAHADPSSELATKPSAGFFYVSPSRAFCTDRQPPLQHCRPHFRRQDTETGPLAAGLGVAFHHPDHLVLLPRGHGAPLASIAMGRGDNAKAERIRQCLRSSSPCRSCSRCCAWAMRPMLLCSGQEQTIGYAVDYFRSYPLGTGCSSRWA